MIVVTAGTAEYRSIVESQARRCEDFGYYHRIFDIGGLGIGEPFAVPASDFAPQVNGDSLPAATFKAALVEKAFAGAGQGELVCWLDADCLPLQKFDPWTRGAYFDAAVTLRPEPEIGLSNNPALDYLNSGVVWFRNNNEGRALCSEWGTLSREQNTDQGALNDVVCPGWNAAAWNAARGNIVTTDAGASILVLDAMEWNCWHPPFTGARIAHFKRGIRGQAVNYL